MMKRMMAPISMEELRDIKQTPLDLARRLLIICQGLVVEASFPSHSPILKKKQNDNSLNSKQIPVLCRAILRYFPYVSSVNITT